MDYTTYRVTFAVTVDVEVPPGVDDRFQEAADRAESFMYKHAPDVDWVLAEVDDITREPEAPDRSHEYREDELLREEEA